MGVSAYQFDAPDADIVLFSGELEHPTEFRVHRSILGAASPFFFDMFSLPQSNSSEKQLPVITVAETHSTVDTLLRFTYPLQDPYISSLDDLIPVLGAAVKYDFFAVIANLRKLLVSPRFVQSAPTRVYAIACRYDLEDEAKVASSYTLGVNILDAPLSEDLKYSTAYSYHRLLDLHRRRVRDAVELIKMTEDIKCMECNGSSFSVFSTPKWWNEFEKRAKEELAVRPTTDVIFGMEFLFKVANASKCQRCAGSILDSWRFLLELKTRIDELPSMI